MTTQAQYDATGQILATIYPNGITNPDQIAALAAKGVSLVTIPDGKSSSTGSIVDGAYQDYPAPGAPIPDISTQLVAALINNGTVDASAFHQTTLAQVNASLTSVGLTAAQTTIGAASKSA